MGNKELLSSKTLGFAGALLVAALGLTVDLLTNPAVSATIPLAWAPVSLTAIAFCVAVLRVFTGTPLAGTPAATAAAAAAVPPTEDLLAYLNLTQSQQQAILRTITLLEQRLAAQSNVTVTAAPTPITTTPPPLLTIVPRTPPAG